MQVLKQHYKVSKSNLKIQKKHYKIFKKDKMKIKKVFKKMKKKRWQANVRLDETKRIKFSKLTSLNKIDENKDINFGARS